MDLLEFKCPNCSGPIEFAPGTQDMVCPFCSSVISIEALKAMDEEFSIDHDAAQGPAVWDYEGGEWNPEEQQGMAVYSCMSCGGEIVCDETSGAASCPFCGNPVVMASKFAGTLRPDMVIPFKLGKDAALASLQKHYVNKKLLPKTFKDKNHLDEIKGVYVPFWLFDAEADAHMEYSATKARYWNDKNYNYVETSYYRVIREGEVGFDRVPVGGSRAIENTLMESIEPYSMGDAVDFKAAYLAGYYANKYSADADESSGRANDRIRNSTVSEFAKTASGYDSVTPKSTNINLKSGGVRYALLPAWLLSTSWQGENFLFAMNGQTGKFVGDLPFDKKMKRSWYWKIFLILFAVMLTVLLLTLLPAVKSPAVETNEKQYIIDDVHITSLSGAVHDFLSDYARDISKDAGVDVAFFMVDNGATPDRNLSEYANEYYSSRARLGSDGFALICDYDTEACEVVSFGKAKEILTENAIRGFIGAFDAEKTFGDGAMAYFNVVDAYLNQESGGKPDPQNGSADGRLPRFIDGEGLLSQAEAAALTTKLDKISARYRFDTVVAVVHSLNYQDARVFAADFYEQNGFGFGDDLDGIILLLATEDRDFAFVTTGYGFYAFTDAGQEYLEELFLPYLKENKYFNAFTVFAGAVQDFLDKAEAGKPYNKDNIPKVFLTAEEWNYIRFFIAVIGLIIAFFIPRFVTNYWAGELKTVRKSDLAGAYLREGGVALTVQKDIFLYSHVTQTLRKREEKDSESGGGGSGVFKSSSGRSFSGRSGKY